MDTGNNGRQIQSLVRAQEILEYIRHENGARLSDIATATGLSPGNVHTYLATLRRFGYIAKHNDQYEIGPRFVPLGEFYRNQSVLYTAGRDVVDDLAERTEQAVHLIVENNGRGIALYERLGETAIGADYHRRLRQQAHQHLHCTASGKAILARLPQSRVDTILEEHGLAAQTPNTITSSGALLNELAEVKQQGFARNNEEEVLGIYAIGAAVRNPAGGVEGAISVSMPKTRANNEEFSAEIRELVLEAANKIEVNIQTGDD